MSATRTNRTGIAALAGMVFILCLLVLPQGSQAAKSSVVTWLEGRAPEVRAAPRSQWVAAWSEQPAGQFTLWVVDGNNGGKREVTKSEDPGGLCWIPYHEQLFYCKGVYVADLGATRVAYYVYDPATGESTKITHVMDVLPPADAESGEDSSLAAGRPETFKLLPVAAEDGSLVFHMTLDVLPSFNLYYPEEGQLRPRPAAANIGADYDLSSDGTMLYWPLTDPEGNPCFVGWNLRQEENDSLNHETWNMRLNAAQLPVPADGGGVIRVDSPNKRIATLAWSEAQPRLQLYVFQWNDQTSSVSGVYPVLLESGEEIRHYDWKGFSGEVYAVIHDTINGTYGVELIDPLYSRRERLVWGTDEISFVDYSPGSKTYYYTVVDEQARAPRTAVIRVQE